MIDRSVFPFVEMGEVVTLGQAGGMTCDAKVVDISDCSVTVETGEVFGKIRFTFLKGCFQSAMGLSPEDSPIISEYPEDRKDAIRLLDRAVKVIGSCDDVSFSSKGISAMMERLIMQDLKILQAIINNAYANSVDITKTEYESAKEKFNAENGLAEDNKAFDHLVEARNLMK